LTRGYLYPPVEPLFFWSVSPTIGKAGELKKYIRDTLKENLGVGYSSLAVENILLEMFNDSEYSKQRVLLEILEYQKKI